MAAFHPLCPSDGVMPAQAGIQKCGARDALDLDPRSAGMTRLVTTTELDRLHVCKRCLNCSMASLCADETAKVSISTAGREIDENGPPAPGGALEAAMKDRVWAQMTLQVSAPAADKAASAAARIDAQTASTSLASVVSAPTDTRTVQRPSMIPGVR